MSLCEFKNFKKKCERAEQEFKRENYIFSLVLYSEIVAQSPGNVSFLQKRSDCFTKLHEYKLAIGDLENAIEIEINQKTLYEKLVEYYLIIGNVAAAEKTMAKFTETFSDQKMSEEIVLSCERLKKLLQEIDDSFRSKNFVECLNYVNEAILTAHSYLRHNLSLLKMHCLIILKKTGEANEFSTRFGAHKDEPTYLNALTKYYDGDCHAAFRCLEEIKGQLSETKMFRLLNQNIVGFIDSIEEGVYLKRILLLNRVFIINIFSYFSRSYQSTSSSTEKC